MRRIAAGMCVLAVSVPAFAELKVSYQFVGRGNWAIDAVGSNGSPVGTLSVSVPAGSTIQRAFLYSSTNGIGTVPSVRFADVDYGPEDFEFLGAVPGGQEIGTIQAYRADVTPHMLSLVGSGREQAFELEISRETPTERIDGEVLVVVYSNPNEKERTIALLDGGSSPDGSTFSFYAASPLPDPSQPDFEALLSLGIGFSAPDPLDPNPSGDRQLSRVNVNGRRLTSSAGGYDDGDFNENGALITAGGVGDSFLNPPDPFFENVEDIEYDDELYNLAFGNAVDPTPFIRAGDMRITISTENPSDNDNIFFAGFNITAVGLVPEPATLLGIGALALLGLRRR